MSNISRLTTIAAAGAGGDAGWYLAFRDSTSYDKAYSVKVDSNNDIYVAGIAFDTGLGSGRGGFMTKIAPDASFIWSKTYSSADRNWIVDFDFDGSGGIITCGYINTTSGDIYGSKISTSDGSTSWVKKTSGNSIDTSYRGIWDGAVFVTCGITYSLTSQTGCLYSSVNPSNGVTTNFCQKGSYTNRFWDLCKSGSYYYYVGNSSASGLARGFIQRAYNALGSSLVTSDVDSNADWVGCDSIGSSDAVVIGASNINRYVMRINTSINQVWRKTINPPVDLILKDVVTDSSDNIYVLQAGTGFTVTKLDSSGTMLWSNRMSNSQGNIAATRICLNEDEDVFYVSGSDVFSVIGSTTGGCAFVAKLPSDGSGTGTADNFTYEATSTVVAAGGNLTKFNDSLTNAFIYLPSSTYANTTASVTYGTNLTNL